MRMPVIFAGHGDPMIALREDEITNTLTAVGQKVIENYGKPKAILAISAHWYTHGLGSLIQNMENPPQINDMFGFPDELYNVHYFVKGSPELSERVQNILGEQVKVDNDWGIDHGIWTIFVHMFPAGDIPIVEFSVDIDITAEKTFEIGKKLAPLRDEGYLIFGSGNIVHNLREIEWDNPNGTEKTWAFNEFIIDAVKSKDIDKVLAYEKIPNVDYAFRTPEHYLPLIYCLGATDGDDATVFNNVCNLGSIAMTGFIFENKGGLSSFFKNIFR